MRVSVRMSALYVCVRPWMIKCICGARMYVRGLVVGTARACCVCVCGSDPMAACVPAVQHASHHDHYVHDGAAPSQQPK